jgi:flagellar biosynthesis anti-sigma factor FlgM
MGEIRKPGETVALNKMYEITTGRRTCAPGAAEPRDGAQIGDAARELNRAKETVDAAPDVRSWRVVQLRSQIQHGTYQPDAREVARQILARGL